MPERGNFLLFRDENDCETVVNTDRMKYAQFKKDIFGGVTIFFEDGSLIKVAVGGESAYTWVHLCQLTGRNLDDFKPEVMVRKP